MPDFYPSSAVDTTKTVDILRSKVVLRHCLSAMCARGGRDSHALRILVAPIGLAPLFVYYMYIGLKHKTAKPLLYTVYRTGNRNQEIC